MQSIITNKERLNSKLINCSDGSEYTSAGSWVSINLTIDDGANAVLLSTSSLMDFNEGYELQTYNNVVHTGYEYPIWINSGSTLRSNMAWNSNLYSEVDICFGSEQIGKVYISILEFDTE